MKTFSRAQSDTHAASGLEGIVVADTSLSEVDGERGQLFVAGYPIETLAPSATFEQVAHLLLEGEQKAALPQGETLDGFAQRLAQHRQISPAIGALLDDAAKRRVEPMDALRMGVAALEAGEDDPDTTAILVASLPTIVAHYWRRRQGKDPLEVRPELGHAAHTLSICSKAQSLHQHALEPSRPTSTPWSIMASTPPPSPRG